MTVNFVATLLGFFQDEINSKLKAILNVIEMLSSIIKDGKKVSDLEIELEMKESQAKKDATQSTGTGESSSSEMRSDKDKNGLEADNQR